MSNEDYKSEIRSSIIRDLLEKARKGNYSKYLNSITLERIRFFQGAKINFDFPVTALIGPNGGGKSTILGVAALAYFYSKPETFFMKSSVGDDSMDDWLIDYEIIDKELNPKGFIKSQTLFKDNQWIRTNESVRQINFFGINRTVPVGENSAFSHKRSLRSNNKRFNISSEPVKEISHIKIEAERILGKSLAHFQLLKLTMSRNSVTRIQSIDRIEFDGEGRKIPIYKTKREILTPIISEKQMFIGNDGKNEYSEFNFGAGEASVIRMVADAESLPDYSLILIKEIENGLHPIAVRRLVEYFIDVANRKKLQVIFTTHSDYALTPLPSEAIWAAIDGKIQQGKLSIEMLRAVSGRIDKRLAVFVEDKFAKHWVEAVLREKLGERLDEIGIYPVAGDGNAVKVHLGHISNPSISFHSVCLIDGDSEHKEDNENRIYKLPGKLPEFTVFNSVLKNLDNNIAFLTVACQRTSDKQEFVANEIRKISHTNRDPHLLFNQVGLNIGFVPEAIVRGAFLSTWIQENPEEAGRIAEQVRTVLNLPPKNQTN